MSSTKRRKRRKATNLLPLEPLFEGVRAALMHDLADSYMRRSCERRARGEDILINTGCAPYTFKKFKQLLDFDKRVIWSSDKSFDDLSTESFSGFVDSQKGFWCPEPMSRRALLVIHRAREICQSVLGEFSYDEWFDSCSFGKRAAVGLPRSKSYLDTRLERLSGTDKQLAAFNECLARDVHLFRAVRKRCRQRNVVDHIKATAVPKSFKSARIIAPDTILGGFLSRGLGDVIRARLEKETHIDLSLQQDRHRRWARIASTNGYLSTIDMSKASDSFTWRHIELLVPSDWHEALDVVRSRRCEVDGKVVDLTSYMLMGSGHTFPLQTLLFYCLAEATRTLLNRRGKVSVYGDDIMLPTQCARPFIVVMSELGFKVNSEKSFYDQPDPERPSHTFFRESCGGDYKGGIDVRPYMPECDLQEDGTVSRNEYVAWCHKITNGLLTRWDVAEIPSTVAFLVRMLASESKAVCFVPTWEVDHAGIKFHIPSVHLLGLNCAYMKYDRSVPTYWRLVFEQPRRKRSWEERPYIWYSHWLHRHNNVCENQNRPLLQLKKREDKSVTAHYSEPISLTGESRRDVKGTFRWKNSAAKERQPRKAERPRPLRRAGGIRPFVPACYFYDETGQPIESVMTQ
jgi:hypothetical protein